MKAKLIKSKSSNTNIKMNKKDKKCRSNADIQDAAFKKKNPGNSNEDEDAPKRPKTVRRPGRKRFLPFVLTMLSKSTTGTQFPDAKIKKNKIKTRKRKIYDDDLIGDLGPNDEKLKYKSKTLNEEKADKEIENLIVLQSKKEIIQTPSNNSQWSSKEPLKLSDIPPSVPKIASDNNNGNTSTIKPVVDAETANEKHKKLLSYINFANTNYLDSNKEKENHLTLVDLNKDPVTLVSEDTKKDAKIYNFFVDLLETTFNVYNVNTTFDVGTEDNQITSKIAWSNEADNKKSNTDIKTAVEAEPKNETNYLSIYDEDWDDKLLDDVETMNLRDLSPEKPLTQYNQSIIKNNNRTFTSTSQNYNRQPVQNNYYPPITHSNNLPVLRLKKQNMAGPLLQNNYLEDLNEGWTYENTDFDMINTDVSPALSIIKEKRRNKPKMLITRRPLQPAKSFDYPTTGKYRKYSKNHEKKTFLNLLKEQLSADDGKYVEPQNLFEALQVMARYKNKCKKSIRFEDTHTTNDGDEIRACMYKRRRLISSGKKTNKNSAAINKNIPKKPASTASKKLKSVAKSSRPMIINEYNKYGSRHSLEVYNDYSAEMSDIYY